ncbi:MAG: hypothetical protein ABFD89_09655 [Bryobacteraceae bacterium]
MGDYDLVPAKPTAVCPRCGKRVTLEASFIGNVSGACRHYDHAELIEGKPFVAFVKPKEKAHAQAHTH